VRYVFTVVDGKAHRVEIKTGPAHAGASPGARRLKAGDVVITSGQTKPIMHEGLGVQVLPSQGAPQQGQQKPPAQAAAKPAPQQKTARRPRNNSEAFPPWSCRISRSVALYSRS
jgi:membrane fusion protein (multidrug efflux system)